MKITLEDADIAKIAAATVALFKAEGGTVAPKDTATPPPKGTPPKGGKGKGKVVDKNDVLKKIREYGVAVGDKDKAKALISEYGENFNAVSAEDMPKLDADVDAAIAALEAGAADEDDL